MYWHHDNTNAINRAAKANNILDYGANYTRIRGGIGTFDYHNSAPNQKLVKNWQRSGRIATGLTIGAVGLGIANTVRNRDKNRDRNSM